MKPNWQNSLLEATYVQVSTNIVLSIAKDMMPTFTVHQQSFYQHVPEATRGMHSQGGLALQVQLNMDQVQS